MMLSPVLLGVIPSVVVALASSIAAPLVSAIANYISRRERTVALKLKSGQEVRLELDTHLSSQMVSELVEAAVRSAQSGDSAAVLRTVDASHKASREARAAAR